MKKILKILLAGVFMLVFLDLMQPARAAACLELTYTVADTLEVGGVMTREKIEALRARQEQARLDSLAREQAYADSLLKVRAAKDSLRFVQDSLRHVEDSIRRSFNGLHYSLQKRLRPVNETFVQDVFMDNTFVMAHVGTTVVYPQGDHTGTDPGLLLGVSVGKWLTPYHAIRFGLGGGSFFQATSDNRIWRPLSLQAAHMFNIMSYVGGYKPSRIFEVSTVEGLSCNLSLLDKKVSCSAGVHLGFNFSFLLTSQIDFFFEPLFSFYTDNCDFSGHENWRGYDAGLDATFGLAFNLMSVDNRREKEEDVADNVFFSFAGGMQCQNTELIRRTMPFAESIGGYWDFTAGKWLYPFLALNTGVFYSYNKWGRFADGTDIFTHYGGLKIEMMFDPLAFLYKDAERRFRLPLFVGPEAGFMHKDDLSTSVDKIYLGFTCGLQAEYKFHRNFSIFLEPRLSIVPYAVQEKVNEVFLRSKYYDRIMNFSIGIKYYL